MVALTDDSDDSDSDSDDDDVNAPEFVPSQLSQLDEELWEGDEDYEELYEESSDYEPAEYDKALWEEEERRFEEEEIP